ncbi:hypothetical protein C8F04DRAFT_404029 [Mycena alexandri]|uniref:Uncharacterized protein n=1 Tax=Mycena alexandri TaxID=1745969 RepID=A0AAD6X5S5_9AGAR|nr:hypothetical protein C8F04DRAFT_404029 [Mycena alexandri]
MSARFALQRLARRQHLVLSPHPVMVFRNVGAVRTFCWILLTALPTLAFPTQGAATWMAPAANAIVAECYPLSIQFASPVPAHNISFYYYYGAQTVAAETYIPITVWPQSQWVDANTLYKVDVASVPVAAGTMMALNVQNYDSTLSWVHAIVVQPNTDNSCITSVKQQGIPDYNHYPVTPITTTVSPVVATPATPPSSSPSVPVAPTKGTPSDSTTPKTPAAPSSALHTASAPSATASAPVTPPTTNPSSPTSVPDGAGAPSTDPALRNGAAKGTTDHTPIIAGVTVGGLVLLVLAGAISIWCMRRRRRQHTAMMEKRVSLVEPYGASRSVPRFRPAPIQEVDGGDFMEPDRLPPQYDDIPRAPASYSRTESTTDINPVQATRSVRRYLASSSAVTESTTHINPSPSSEKRV